MKIGLICPYNIARGGGVREHILSCQAELQKRGHDVWVLTPKPREDESVPLQVGKKVIFVGGSVDFTSMHTTSQVSASVNDTIDEVLAEHQFDILHFHEPWVPMLSAQILSRSRTINVATFHAKLPETMVTRTMVRMGTPYTKSVLKYIHECTAVSGAAAEYVSTLTEKPITIIPNGIDLTMYKAPARRNDNKKDKTILFIGRLEQRKGVKHLLQAFKYVNDMHPQVSLLIAGDGPDRPKLEAMVEDLDIKNVRFVGFITEKEKIQYLRASDLYCSPALYGESFGIVLLEAMASGLVTVGGDNPGYASVMKGLGALSLVNPKHHAEFARRLSLLLYENDLRRLWREWAAAELPQYDYRAIVDKYEALYKKALTTHAESVKSKD